MGILVIIFLLFVIALLGTVFWLYKILLFYKTGCMKKANYHLLLLLLLVLFICWKLRIIPLSQNFDFKNKTADLTGKVFWCWNNYRFDEIGVRGEGFTFEIYNLNDEMAKYFANPDSNFFKNYPAKHLKLSYWQKTPITDLSSLDHWTPFYINWPQRIQIEIKEKQNIVKQICRKSGSYYSTGNNDFYLISPEQKLFIYINQNN